jgi:hypothetical protein
LHGRQNAESREAALIWPARGGILSGLMVLCLGLTGESALGAEAPLLDIAPDPSGGFQATGILHIPAPPQVVRAVLTDYDTWPALFNGRFRIVRLQREADRVVTDLMIKRSPFPGELRLLCETRATPDGGLLTTRVDGDFKRYVRRWRFESQSAGPAMTPVAVDTRAVMELSFELETVVPDWIVAYNLRRELLDHFRILREKALVKAAQQPSFHE